jgi:hypothetical protein
MIVKHFCRNVWELGYNWENTDYVFGVPDSDLQMEQNEKLIAASLEISNDEQDMEEGGGGRQRVVFATAQAYTVIGLEHPYLPLFVVLMFCVVFTYHFRTPTWVQPI